MAQIPFKNPNDNVVYPLTVPDPGRADAGASKPVVLSNEDLAVLGAKNEAAAGTDIASSGHTGLLKRIAQRLTSLIGLFPTALGVQLASASLSVVPVGRTGRITSSPAVAAAAYTAGNVVGGVMQFLGLLDAANSGVLQTIRIRSNVVNAGTTWDLYLFHANPVASAFTDKTMPAIIVADKATLIGCYSLSAGKSGLGSHTVWELDGIGAAIVNSSPDVFGVLVCTGTAPTFTATTDLTVSLLALKD